MRFIIILVWLTASGASQIEQPFNEVDNDDKTELTSDSLVIRELIKRVASLEARDRRLTLEVEDLKQEVASQKNEMTALCQVNDKQDRMISRLMHRLLLHGEISPAYRNNAEDDAAMKTTFEGKDNRIRRSENEVTVAFTAGLTQTMQHIGAHQNIIFDHIETNVGNGYNPHHGVFTAPVAGIYVFYTSVLADNDREIWCQLVVNGNNKANAYARVTDGRHDQGSQAVIVQLQKGDDVAVQSTTADDAVYGGIYSTFSGFLLQQDFQQSGSVVG